jgi:CheY-like chemotaxis protein
VSRIITGKTRLDIQPVDVVSVIDHAVATVRPAADAKGVRLQAVLDRQTAPISGDADRLQQVIWNLLSNAVKFTARGGRVQIQLARVNSHVEIVVSDTGIGIAPEFLPYVFDRFRQADSQFSRQHGGLGLGLAICRHLVELHGGLIRAASDGEGTGATFRVHLPVMIVHADRSLDAVREHPRAERSATDPGRGRLNGIHVFAVDDEADALTLLREILEQAGAEVTTLSSAEEALDAMETTVPDALITDIGMPGTDGFELIRRIRQSPDGAIRAVPAAALTAYARSEDRTRTLRSGFQLHLSKPIDPGELVAAVEALIRRGQFLH